MRGHDALGHLTETLNLTPDQQAKVQPIIDQARPQLAAIHREAMEKSKGVMDNTMAQIRPMLTPEQQKKADELRQAHEEMRKAKKRLRDLKKDS
jgi:Spy/CpxP family protein refolding chaperone